MVIIKASTAAPDTMFVLDGLEYPKDNYDLTYLGEEVSAGVYNPDTLKVGLKNKHLNDALLDPQPLSRWSDGTSGFATWEDLWTHLGEVILSAGGGGSGSQDTTNQGQLLDSNNTQDVTSADAAPASPWQGDWVVTRGEGVIRVLTVLASTDTSVDGLGGTFIFEFSEDGINATISETRTIDDFQTVRDFDLLNAGAYYRCSFEPDRALAGDTVFVSTTLRKEYDGQFVRLANQEIERQNAAMGQTFAYNKGFDPVSGKSVDITNFNQILTDLQTPTTPLGADEDWTADNWVDTLQMGHFIWLIAGTEEFATVELEWSDDGINPNGNVTTLENSPVTEPIDYNVYLEILSQFTSGRYWRAHIINGAVAQNAAQVAIASSGKDQYTPIIGLTDDISFLSSAILNRSIQAGVDPVGNFVNAKVSGTVSEDNFETSGALLSGTLPTYDPVNVMTDANVLDTGWLPTEGFFYNNFRAFFDIAGIKIFLIDASDELGNNSTTNNFLFPTATTVQGGSVNVGARLFQDYFRIIIINDTGTDSNQWAYRSAWLTTDNGSVILSLDQPVLDFFPAPIIQSVQKGKTPNGIYEAIRSSGRHLSNSTEVLLNGGEVFRGEWFPWQGIYVGMQTEVSSDVTGTLFLDFSNSSAPVDGDDTSIDFSIDNVYDPNEGFGTDRRITPTQSRYVRVRYVNDATAQSTFSIDTAFLTSAVPDVTEPLSIIPQLGVLAGIKRVKLFAEDENGDHGYINRTGSAVDVHLKSGEIESPIKPLNQINTGQGSVISTDAVPIPSAGAGLTNRKTIEFSNHSGTVPVYFGKNAAVTQSTGKILRAGSDVVVEVDESVDFYWIAADTGGSSTIKTEEGSSASGTATGVANILASDDTYATFTNGQTGIVTGFTHSLTLAEVTQLRICVEGKKAATPTTLTVTHVETQVGQTSGATSVVSASMAGGSDLLYVVSIARNDLNNVSGVTGGGLSWTQQVINSENADSKRLDVWYAYGTPTAGAVTATMSTSTRASISVSSFSGVDGDNPIEASSQNTGSGSTASGQTLNKTNLGLGYFSVVHDADSATAASGYTERSDFSQATGSNKLSLATGTKAFTVTGSEAATMTLSSSVEWASASLRILPSEIPDATYTVEYDVDGAGYVAVGGFYQFGITEETKYIDISGTHPLTSADINLTSIRLTRTNSAAVGTIDRISLEVTEGTADSAARISYVEVADTEI